jgi:sec-independent protein translocase protein TatB
MLPDLSPTHILIFVIVAIVVVGPKDLPMLLRKVGQFMGKMRGMANEFRASFDEMARQSELDDLRKEVEAMRQAANNPTAANLGLSDDLKLDSQGDYMAQWTQSQAEADALNTDGPLNPGHEPFMTPLPAAEPVAEAAPATKVSRARKPRATTEADEAEAEPTEQATPKPRARRKSAESEA